MEHPPYHWKAPAAWTLATAVFASALTGILALSLILSLAPGQPAAADAEDAYSAPLEASPAQYAASVIGADYYGLSGFAGAGFSEDTVFVYWKGTIPNGLQHTLARYLEDDHLQLKITQALVTVGDLAAFAHRAIMPELAQLKVYVIHPNDDYTGVIVSIDRSLSWMIGPDRLEQELRAAIFGYDIELELDFVDEHEIAPHFL